MDKELLAAIRGILQEELEPVRQDITGLKQDMTGVKQDMTGMKQDITGIKNQQKEDHDILRALEEASNVHKAENDNLTHDVAEIKGEVKRLNEGQARLEADISDVKAAQREFYEMYGDHETQIRELRRKVASS